MKLQDLKKHNLPDSPGVYFFLDSRKKPIYIGKATSLRDRVKSYFAKDIASKRSPFIAKMVLDIKGLDFKKTSSVLEALLLEADLIKKFKPKYNTKEKDDKSFNCVVIIDEEFPQILIIRKKDLENVGLNFVKVFGPFANGQQLKDALKITRKIFPFRDEKCKLNSLRPCFNYTIGLCPGTCINAVKKTDYKKTVKKIETFLSGNVAKVISQLETDMNKLAKDKRFEEAKILRDKIYALKHINDISLIKSDISSDRKKDFKIEAYDIAHLAGKNMVGGLVVLENGFPKKSEYRKFKIQSCEDANDPKALREVLERRFEHSEWSFPDLIVVDGNTIQLNVAHQFLLQKGLVIPVVAVVKGKGHKAKGFFGKEEIVAKYNKDILLANSEAHRFTIGFHKKLRAKSFL